LAAKVHRVTADFCQPTILADFCQLCVIGIIPSFFAGGETLAWFPFYAVHCRGRAVSGSVHFYPLSQEGYLVTVTYVVSKTPFIFAVCQMLANLHSI